jgi:hypothetical protein
MRRKRGYVHITAAAKSQGNPDSNIDQTAKDSPNEVIDKRKVEAGERCRKWNQITRR